MRYLFVAVAAFALSAVIVGEPARAAAPPGSYQQSCRDITIQGGVLTGTCRTRSGRWERAALGEVNRCAGDIGNLDGALTCDRRTGALPLYGSGQPPAQRWQRQQHRRLRCEGIVDPIARARCFSR